MTSIFQSAILFLMEEKTINLDFKKIEYLIQAFLLIHHVTSGKSILSLSLGVGKLEIQA